jgi:hypothetical protein
VAQGEGPEFKPQYCKKKKKERKSGNSWKREIDEDREVNKTPSLWRQI